MRVSTARMAFFIDGLPSSDRAPLHPISSQICNGTKYDFLKTKRPGKHIGITR